jgi:hypothetical protein
VLQVLLVLVISVCWRHMRPASDRYALIVSGANGEPTYAEQYGQWRQAASLALIEKLGFEGATSSRSTTAATRHVSTAAGVKRALEQIRSRMTAEDVLLVLLIGHGSFDGTEAKFNLVGPDLSSNEWAALLKPLPGRIVVVDSTAASSPFLEHLAGPRRVVITATDSVMQRFDTIFPEYFISR